MPDTDLRNLSRKLVMLLALSNGNTSPDIQVLDIRFGQFTEEGVSFRIPGLTKTRRSGPPKEVVFHSFTADPQLCPVTTLRAFGPEDGKVTRCGEEPATPLLTSFRKPHNLVMSATIG